MKKIVNNSKLWFCLPQTNQKTREVCRLSQSSSECSFTILCFEWI